MNSLSCCRLHPRLLLAMEAPMLALDDQQEAARAWFESLRDRICTAFEEIEREGGSDAVFDYTPWDRTDASGEPGGGGVRGQLTGKVFEKVGVNVSTVGGAFSPEFAKSITGAEEDPSFFATGISLVAHMANPHVPAVHMNTRFLTTTRRWFGGGADLNPAIPYEEDTQGFHARLRAACAAQPGVEAFRILLVGDRRVEIGAAAEPAPGGGQEARVHMDRGHVRV